MCMSRIWPPRSATWRISSTSSTANIAYWSRNSKRSMPKTRVCAIRLPLARHLTQQARARLTPPQRLRRTARRSHGFCRFLAAVRRTLRRHAAYPTLYHRRKMLPQSRRHLPDRDRATTAPILIISKTSFRPRSIKARQCLRPCRRHRTIPRSPFRPTAIASLKLSLVKSHYLLSLHRPVPQKMSMELRLAWPRPQKCPKTHALRRSISIHRSAAR